MNLQVTGIEFMGADDVVVATIGMDGDTLVIKTIEGLKIRAEAKAGVQLLAQDTSVQLDGAAIELQASSAVTVKAPLIDLDASQALRENADGVGHTYTRAQVHYWVPMEGTSNWPDPPLHPMAGSDSLVAGA